MTRFAHPWYIFLLLLILPVVFFWGRSTGGRIRFSSLKILKDIGASTVFHPRQILLLLRVFVIVFFVLALARPQSGKKFTKITSEGIDIMLLLDTSGSMKAMDFELSVLISSRMLSKNLSGKDRMTEWVLLYSVMMHIHSVH